MYIAALDVGGTKTITAILDENGSILDQTTFVSCLPDSYENLDRCVEELNRLLAARGIRRGELKGIGVSLPGIVDRKKGMLLYAPFSKWEQVTVADYLREKTGVQRIECENDVNACAVGELRFGLGSVYSDFVWMTVSTGVGGAIVVDRRLVRGKNGFAGELGHLKVEYDHPHACPCGQLGCLEAHGSGTALNRLTVERNQNDPSFASALRAIGAEKADGKTCAALAAEGNAAALEIFETVGLYLGRGIASCINLLNPQAVVIGGGVSASLDYLLPGIEKALKSDVFHKMDPPKIVRTALGYEAALIGAAALIL
ncbi:MAG: ROK family protein [Oscillospiraceae bacterium]|nr:ROK family protein [Oscillospiraceae bacterium]